MLAERLCRTLASSTPELNGRGHDQDPPGAVVGGGTESSPIESVLDGSMVSAVIVTRGDVDLAPVVDSLPYGEILVWDNTKRPSDLSVFGRYAAIREASNDVIYVQDDDCVFTRHRELLGEYRAGMIVANMPPDHGDYTDSVLVGWGALFDRALPFQAFNRYLSRFPAEPLFLNACDVVFTALTPFRRVDLGFEHLPHAEDEHRMYRRADHRSERAEALERARGLRS